MSEDIVANLQPEALWRHFAAIARIPRGSKNEAAVAAYVRATATRLGLEAQTDAVGNVLVRKPAAPGLEQRRVIALQGHLDMVCEKNQDTTHDFLRDPIQLRRQGNFITAAGTTLGADNGVAVAANLAIMEDRALVHGPLELLFTVDEETGLTGAAGLTADFLRARTLINLDSEDEGVLFTGCAGGQDTIGVWQPRREPAPARHVALELRVSGLRGGHSGMDIDKGRGNAIKIMTRTLRALDGLDARLATLTGGDKHNAIPRECRAVVWLAPDEEKDAERLIAQFNIVSRAELAGVEPDLSISCAPVTTDAPGNVLPRAEREKLLHTLSALPHGVLRMSSDIAGLVETSTNLAVVALPAEPEAGWRIVTFQRGSVASALSAAAASVGAVFALAGVKIEHSEAYPGWRPDMNSAILKTARAAWRELFGSEAQVTAVHAGLECGVIGQRIAGMDMISFGPTMEGVHSPAERLDIASVARFWRFLLEVLRRAE